MIGPKIQKPSKSDEHDAYEVVALRDKDICQRCLRDCGHGVVSRDHRKNRSQGGLTVPSNLQILGGTGTTGCHGFVTEHLAEAIEEGWAVPGWADPLVWPARRWRRTVHGMVRLGWCLYDNQGGVHWITDEEAVRRMNGLVA